MSKCFNFGEKYDISGKFLGVSGKIGVCPENFFDSQNGTLTENFFGDGGVGGQKWPIDGGPPAVALRHWRRETRTVRFVTNDV